MEQLAKFIEKRSLWIALVIAAVSIYSIISIFRTDYNDDITAFFPERSREVTLFKEVGKKFGGLDIALIGLETSDIFSLENLQLIRHISKQIEAIDGVGSVTSLTEMRDFEEKQMGRETGALIQNLVDDIPPHMTPEQIKAVKERVMSREHLIGAVISKDARATLLICKLESGPGMWKVARTIRQITTRAVGDRKDMTMYFGGAPFVSAYIMEGTQNDLKRLSPWVGLAVVAIIFLSFRSFGAPFLALMALIFGLLLTIGFMPIMEISMDLVSTSLPMILASVASAYGIHLLARYFRILSIRKDISRKEAVRVMLKEVGIPVIMAGVTTIVGFASFLVMDIKPLRTFGFMMALGVAVTLTVSILFISAVLTRVKIGEPGKGESGDVMGQVLASIAAWFSNRAKPVLFVVIVVGAVSAYYLSKISTQTSMASYFPKGSEPILADEFMVNTFGGSLFIQLYIEGDIKSPLVLKEMQKLEGKIAGIDGVTDIQSITRVISLASSALTGKEQIPPHRDQVSSLVYLVEDDPAIRLLVDEKWGSAIIQVRVSGFDTKKAKAVAETIRAFIDTSMRSTMFSINVADMGSEEAKGRILMAAREDAAENITFTLEEKLKTKLDKGKVIARILGVLESCAAGCDANLRSALSEQLNMDLIEDELVYIDGNRSWDELVDGVCGLAGKGNLTEEAMYELLFSFATEEEKSHESSKLQALDKNVKKEKVTGFRKGVRIVLTNVQDIYIRWIAVGVIEPFAGKKEENAKKKKKLTDRVMQHLCFLRTGEVIVDEKLMSGVEPGAVLVKKGLKVEVTGYPFLFQRMNESVLTNQVKSVVVALAIIFVLLSVLFRSLIIGLIAAFPAVLTLLLVFGGLGFSGVPMDMGVSMVSIIALGASVDYPIHFLWKYKEIIREGHKEPLLQTMKTTGRAIALNAFEVMAGFGILLFAVIIPVRKAGGLIATTLFIAAAATLFLMPILIKVGGKTVERHLVNQKK
ncbi:MAG: MMPL family transporter [Pseudomonadota bacterium]